ncbi:MAG: hypothetical protein ACI376_03360 [Candidatus Bruticola sp.]
MYKMLQTRLTACFIVCLFLFLSNRVWALDIPDSNISFTPPSGWSSEVRVMSNSTALLLRAADGSNTGMEVSAKYVGKNFDEASLDLAANQTLELIKTATSGAQVVSRSSEPINGFKARRYTLKMGNLQMSQAMIWMNDSIVIFNYHANSLADFNKHVGSFNFAVQSVKRKN